MTKRIPNKLGTFYEHNRYYYTQQELPKRQTQSAISVNNGTFILSKYILYTQRPITNKLHFSYIRSFGITTLAFRKHRKYIKTPKNRATPTFSLRFLFMFMGENCYITVRKCRLGLTEHWAAQHDSIFSLSSIIISMANL